MGIIYYIYLLFIIIFLSILLRNSTKISGIKVRLYVQISLGIFFLRYIILMLFRISRGTSHLYVLRPIVFINALGIIMLSLMYIYIFLKKNTMDFKYVYCFALAFLGAYFTLIKFIVCPIIYDINFGYVLDQTNANSIVYFSYLCTISFFLIVSLLFIDRKNIDTKNIFIFVSILVCVIIENILFISNVRILPYVMISDMLFLVLLYYVIKRLIKSAKVN